MLSRPQVESCESFNINVTECQIVPALKFFWGAGRGMGLLQKQVALEFSLVKKLGRKKYYCDHVFCKM